MPKSPRYVGRNWYRDQLKSKAKAANSSVLDDIFSQLRNAVHERTGLQITINDEGLTLLIDPHDIDNQKKDQDD